MKIVIFSDTHLTSRFDSPKFEFIKKIVKQADQVIINGDFWDGFALSFDNFINSEWKRLFPLLKEKTIYLFGNHDKKSFSDARRSLFSKKASQKLILRLKEKTYLIKHGDDYVSFFDEGKTQQEIPHFYALAALFYESFLIKMFGKKLINLMYKKYNLAQKRKGQKDLDKNQILICGHTHLAETDPNSNYFNSGMINYGLGQYLIIEDGKISLKEEWYR